MLISSIDRWTSALLADDGIDMPFMGGTGEVEATIIAKSSGILAGCAAVDHMLQIWAGSLQISWSHGEGRSIGAGDASPAPILLPSPWLQEICKLPAQICSMWSTAAHPARIPLLFAIIVASTSPVPPIKGISIPSSASRALVHLSMLEISILLAPSEASHNTLPLS